MSGSPVYLEGRLIGAVAYGWSYAKDPIGGITPIAPMIDVAQRKRAAESPKQRASPSTFLRGLVWRCAPAPTGHARTARHPRSTDRLFRFRQQRLGAGAQRRLGWTPSRAWAVT